MSLNFPYVLFLLFTKVVLVLPENNYCMWWKVISIHIKCKVSSLLRMTISVIRSLFKHGMLLLDLFVSLTSGSILLPISWLVILYKTCYFFPFFFLYSIKFIAFKRWLPCYCIKYEHYLQKRCYSWRFYYIPSVQKQRRALPGPHVSLAQPWSYFWLDSFLVSLLQINWVSQCFSNNFCSFLPTCLRSIYFFQLIWFPLYFGPNPIHTSSLHHMHGDFLDTCILGVLNNYLFPLI